MSKIKVLELVSGSEIEVNENDLIYVNMNQYKFDNQPKSEYDVLDYDEYFTSGEHERVGSRDTPFILSDDILYQCEIIEEAPEYNITDIQLFDYAVDNGDGEMIYSYSANVVINDTFIVQVHGDKNESTIDGICHSTDCYWNTEENQDKAYEDEISDIVVEAIEKDGFENNIWWLEENSETMNPENKQYRK